MSDYSYPGKPPESVKRILYPVIQSMAEGFGLEARERKLALSREMAEMFSAYLLATACLAAREVLKEQDSLTVDFGVALWIKQKGEAEG